jgi:hypothetical protein
LETSNKKYLILDTLIRVEYGEICHKNDLFLKRLQEAEAQIYLLKDTIYGCFVGQNIDESLTVLWFGYHKGVGEQIIPDSTYELEEILDNCSEESVEELLYHLNIFSPKK